MKGRTKRALAKHAIHARKRFLAFVLAFTMILTNVGADLNVAYGAASAEAVTFTMSGMQLVDAIDEAIMSGNRVTAEDLDFTDGKVAEYQKLFFGKGSLYEAFPEAEGDGADAELRVFVRLPEDADNMYMVTGDEEVIFLYINNGDETISCTTNITRMVDGDEKVKKTDRVKVKSYEAAFSDVKAEAVKKSEGPGVAETTTGALEETPEETLAETTTEATDETTAIGTTEETTKETTKETTEETTEAPVGGEGEGSSEEVQPSVDGEGTEEEIQASTDEEGQAPANDGGSANDSGSADDGGSANDSGSADDGGSADDSGSADDGSQTVASISLHMVPMVATSDIVDQPETSPEETQAEEDTSEAAVEEPETTTEETTVETMEADGETPAVDGEETTAAAENESESVSLPEIITDDAVAMPTSTDLVVIGDCSTAKAYVTTLNELKALDDFDGYQIRYVIEPESGARIVEGSRGVAEGQDLVFGVKNQIGYAIKTVVSNGVEVLADSVVDNDDGTQTAWYSVSEIHEEQEVIVNLVETMEHPEFDETVAIGDMTIRVTAPVGVLPINTGLEVTDVTSLVEAAAKEKIENEANGEVIVEKVFAYDINLIYNGLKLDNSWATSDNSRVKVEFTGKAVEENSANADSVKTFYLDTLEKETVTALSAETVKSIEGKGGELTSEVLEEEGAITQVEVAKIDEITAEDIIIDDEGRAAYEVSGEESITKVEFDANHFSTYVNAYMKRQEKERPEYLTVQYAKNHPNFKPAMHDIGYGCTGEDRPVGVPEVDQPRNKHYVVVGYVGDKHDINSLVYVRCDIYNELPVKPTEKNEYFLVTYVDDDEVLGYEMVVKGNKPGYVPKTADGQYWTYEGNSEKVIPRDIKIINNVIFVRHDATYEIVVTKEIKKIETTTGRVYNEKEVGGREPEDAIEADDEYGNGVALSDKVTYEINVINIGETDISNLYLKDVINGTVVNLGDNEFIKELPTGKEGVVIFDYVHVVTDKDIRNAVEKAGRDNDTILKLENVVEVRIDSADKKEPDVRDTEDVNLQKTNGYMVIYSPEGAANANWGSVPERKSYESGSTVTVANNINLQMDKSEDGKRFEFICWTTDKSNVNDKNLYYPGETFKIENHMIFYPVFATDDDYRTILFAAGENGRLQLKSEQKTPLEYRIMNGSAFGRVVRTVDNIPQPIPNAEYEFAGWEITSGLETKTYENAQAILADYQNQEVTTNLTFTAKFVRTGRTVTYQAGTNGSGSYMDQAKGQTAYYLTGTNVKLKSFADTGIKADLGYEFAGWKVISGDVTLTPEVNPTQFIMQDANVVLEAQFQPKQYRVTVKYVDDSGEAIQQPDSTTVVSYGANYDVEKLIPDTIQVGNDNYAKDSVIGNVSATEYLVDNDAEVTVVYSLDNVGNSENPDKPDGTPDKYQVRVTYDVVNGTWEEGGDAQKSQWVTLKKDGELAVDGSYDVAEDLPETQANQGYGSGSWEPKNTIVTKETNNSFVHAYIAGNHELVINYVDDSKKRNELKEPERQTVAYDSSYDVSTLIPETIDVGTGAERKHYMKESISTNVSGTVKGDIIIDVVYTLDNVGNSENPNQPDGIPDKYQVKVTYKVNPLKDGRTYPGYVVPEGNAVEVVEYVTLYTDGDEAAGELALPGTTNALGILRADGIEATPENGYAWVEWSIDGVKAIDTVQPTSYTVSADTVIVAEFAEKKATLNYMIASKVGNDKVVAGSVDQDSEEVDAVTGVPTGSKVTPLPGYEFDYWTKNGEVGDKISADANFVPTKEPGTLWEDGTVYYAHFKVDDTQKKDLSYTVKHVVEGVVKNTVKVTENVQVLQPDTLSRIFAKEADQDYPGYTKSGVSYEGGGELADTVDRIENGSVIVVTYVEKPAVQVDYVSADPTMGSVSSNSEMLAPVTGIPVGSTAQALPGYKFTHWTNSQGNTVDDKNETFKPSKDINDQVYKADTYTAHFAERGDLKYTVEYYFDEVLGETILENEAKLGSNIPYVTIPKNHNGRTYIFEKTEGSKTVGATQEESILKVYYTLDEVGEGENPATPDDIPDKYQITLNYVAGYNGRVEGITTEIHTIYEVRRDGVTGEIITGDEIIPAKPKAAVTASANARYSFVNWNVSGGSKTYVNAQAIRNDTFTKDTTFTANFIYNGGGNGSNDGNTDNTNDTGSTGGTVAITPEDIPLAVAPEDASSFITIDDGEIPLAPIPKTGESSEAAKMMLLISGMMMAAAIALGKKKEEE